MKRVALDIVLLLGIFVLFASRMYEVLPAPLQLVTLKALLVSAGVLHAHIVRKLIFPKVDWQISPQGNTYASIVFYTVIPICYAFGG
jgi:hypothetical protein